LVVVLGTLVTLLPNRRAVLVLSGATQPATQPATLAVPTVAVFRESHD
jgi:hypothetical protein